MKHMVTLAIILAIAVLALMPHAAAAVPQKINYQGRLTDSAGAPVPDDDYQIVFTIYDTATGGVGL